MLRRGEVRSELAGLDRPRRRAGADPRSTRRSPTPGRIRPAIPRLDHSRRRAHKLTSRAFPRLRRRTPERAKWGAGEIGGNSRLPAIQRRAARIEEAAGREDERCSVDAWRCHWPSRFCWRSRPIKFGPKTDGVRATAGDIDAKFEYCTTCHGPSAQGFRGYFIMPRLAGQQPQYIENQLHAFLERRRSTP